MLWKQILAFRPSALDLIFAFKTFIAGMLALFVSFKLDLINPMWSIGTVLIIASPYSGMVSSKCVYRLLGTVIGATVALLLTPSLLNTPWLFSVVLALWVGFALYISLLDRTPRSYMFMLAGYSTAMIVCNSVAFIDQYNIFDLALARVLEISIGVIAHAVVSATILPVHIGDLIKQRLSQLFKDTESVLYQLLSDEHSTQDYPQVLATITRDSSDIHALAVHLSYEKGELQGMTKSLQEMLHQSSMAVANLVAISEKRQQLKQLGWQDSVEWHNFIQYLSDFLNPSGMITQSALGDLTPEFEHDFQVLMAGANPAQSVVLFGLKRDLRHFIENFRTVKCIWALIQNGQKVMPEHMQLLTTNYPSLHRDYGVAVRGGISALLITFIVCALWILSGWHMGFMMAQMGAVTACILTALDNPVPVLRIFIWGSIVSAGLVFIYAFGIFPYVTTFWQLALVLLPLFLVAVSMMARPNLMPIGMVLGINTMMGMNLHNRYQMDAVAYFDSSFAMIAGVLISLIVLNLVRAMSPDMSATRILALHNKAMYQAVSLVYGQEFRIHLRVMLDRIGILNTKVVQDVALKKSMNQALIECSAVVDLARLQELSQQLQHCPNIVQNIRILQDLLQQMFLVRHSTDWENAGQMAAIHHQIAALLSVRSDIAEPELALTLSTSLYSIQHNICHQHDAMARLPYEPTQHAEAAWES